MTKSAKVITAVVVIIIIVVGAYAIFHKSPTPYTNNTSTTNQNNAKPNNSIILTKTSATLGQYLTDGNGRPLYTYASDTAGVSNCTGSCLTNWPAYTASSSTPNLPSGITTFQRSDNKSVQYAYNGMPLYYFTGDSNGQVTGDGVESFHVAKPSSAGSSNQPASTNNSPSSPY